MMEAVKYMNSRGDSVDLNANGVVIDVTGLMAWSLDHEEINGRIASFESGVVTRKASCATYSMEARNRLYDIPSYDLANSVPGRLYVGDWYLRCNMTASSPEHWWRDDGGATYDLSFTIDDPAWCRDTEYVYTERHHGGEGLDFPYDFMHDYGYAPTTVVIVNANSVPAEAVIRIYGPVVDPTIEVAGNTYGIKVTLEQGDYATIDTYEKTVVVTRLTGDVENAFDDAMGDYMVGSGSYIFEKIKPGNSDVVWSGLYDFDITVIERRYEPRWG